MKLSIIMPVYNEEKTLLKILDRVEKTSLPNVEKEVIIVDDFSKDRTREILKKIKNVKIILHKRNLGKGAAIRTGLREASGGYIIIQDADLEYNPDEYKNLVEEMKKRKAKAVYGSRALNKANKHSYLSYYLGNLLLNFLTNLLFFSKLTDMETCYKLINRKLISSLNLKSNKFDIEPEITAKILKRGIKIYEVPITYNPRSKQEGKKIRWQDGAVAIWTLIKYRFTD